MQVGACGGALRTPFQQGGGSGATENRVARNSAGVSGAAMPHMVPSVPSDPFWLHTMFDELLTKIFGSRNDRLIKQYRRKCDAINKLEPAMQALSDEELKAKTQEFRDRIAKGATTDELLPEAFAVVREASVRVLGMRHFDVQLIGAMVLNDGKIAEMRTGEGKTLTATLAVYLNALPGKGCHVVTVNDYLASRDADWMGRLYNWLGLSVGKILSNQNNEEKRAAYASDITYGTNNEFGFDYLRDNMEYDVAARRQRPLYYAIVDEVDSILIDEARTPLIISGPADDNTELYRAVNDIPPLLTRQAEEKGEGDYWVDEKAHQVYLSEAGHEHLEQILSERGLVQQGESLYAPKNIILMHHLNAALRAHTLFHRDQHYVVQNGEIVIVDEFTGRLMPGRRWSEGLHQAVEAKEGVKIQQENQTMASITFQNFFRMYGKLSGMTGTADTEAYEFQDIYGLETVVVPTHRKMVRIDEQDKVYRTVNEKYRAIIDDVKACYERRQPVLLGTTSIENSELLSSMLTKEGIPHNVLNAKQHDREAQIVLEAGRPGVVTIATNMAGRGTDIVLGGGINKAVDAIRADETLTEEQREAKIAEVKAEWQKLHDIVVEAGGLRIIGSMRRRLDDESKARGLNFTLIATPAEGLSGRFVKLDQKRYGIIPGVTDRAYYTNSFHVPVYFPIKAFRKIEIEAPYHAFTNAGHITYVELDGDTAKNPEAFEAVIRYMHDKGVGYGSINHPVDRDPVCGYVGVINDVCPRCGRHEGEAVSEEKLAEIRRRFPNMPPTHYGRNAEIGEVHDD